jgi:hypothetical protein
MYQPSAFEPTSPPPPIPSVLCSLFSALDPLRSAGDGDNGGNISQSPGRAAAAADLLHWPALVAPDFPSNAPREDHHRRHCVRKPLPAHLFTA